MKKHGLAILLMGLALVVGLLVAAPGCTLGYSPEQAEAIRALRAEGARLGEIVETFPEKIDKAKADVDEAVKYAKAKADEFEPKVKAVMEALREGKILSPAAMEIIAAARAEVAAAKAHVDTVKADAQALRATYDEAKDQLPKVGAALDKVTAAGVPKWRALLEGIGSVVALLAGGYLVRKGKITQAQLDRAKAVYGYVSRAVEGAPKDEREPIVDRIADLMPTHLEDDSSRMHHEAVGTGG